MPSDEESIKARGPPGKKLAGKAEIQAEQLIVRITSEVIDRVKNRLEQAQSRRHATFRLKECDWWRQWNACAFRDAQRVAKIHQLKNK